MIGAAPNEQDLFMGKMISATVPEASRLCVEAETNDFLKPEQQWARIVAALREHGYFVGIQGSDEVENPSLGAAISRVETRVRQVLARVAPPGSNVTPEMLRVVRAQVHEVITEELANAGLPDATSKALAAILAVTMQIKPKVK